MNVLCDVFCSVMFARGPHVVAPHSALVIFDLVSLLSLWQDPRKPKRGMTAFVLFCNDRRPAVRKENPGIAFGDIARILSADWRALTPEKKAVSFASFFPSYP